MIRPILFFYLIASLAVIASGAFAQEAAEFFHRNCKSCHTIGGGRLVGPDLKDVTKRKDAEWLKRFVQNPKAMLDSGDPYALQLRQDARGIVMPTIPGLSPIMAEELLEMITRESQSSITRFAGAGVSDRPFTSADLQTGAAVFDGTRRLSAGGPPCISCHTLGTLHGMGGGRLGPDLTLVYERLGGRKSVGAWLSAPGASTMQAVFRQHPLQSDEILPLLAVFENASQKAQPANSGSEINFFLAGFAGLCVGLAMMGWVWRGRFRNVRRSLVNRARGVQ